LRIISKNSVTYLYIMYLFIQVIAIALNLTYFSPLSFIMKTQKYKKEFKELYTGHPYSHHLDYTVANLLLHLFHHLPFFFFSWQYCV
jgi:hypothetical protein